MTKLDAMVLPNQELAQRRRYAEQIPTAPRRMAAPKILAAWRWTPEYLSDGPVVNEPSSIRDNEREAPKLLP
jgi:hypothetical protein